MLIMKTETYRCDGCGFKKDDPIGWSYLVPLVIGNCDFRSGVYHYCDGCVRQFPKPPATC